jgi:hypothetical protein
MQDYLVFYNESKTLLEEKVEVEVSDPFQDLIARLTKNDPSITELNKKDVQVTDEHLRGIFAALVKNTHVTYLDLSIKRDGSMFIKEIVQLVEKNTRLEDIHLDGWKFESAQVDLIAEAVKLNPNIQEITLGTEKDQEKLDAVLDERE